MTTMASEITSLTIVCSNRLFRRRSKKIAKLRVTGLSEGNPPVNFPNKGPVTREMFPFDDVIMIPEVLERSGYDQLTSLNDKSSSTLSEYL